MWVVVGTAALAGPPALVSIAEEHRDLDVHDLVGSADGDVAAVSKEWVQRLGVKAPAVELESADIHAVDLSPEGWLAISSKGGVTVHGPDGREMLRLGGTGDLAGVALSPDGTRLALASASGVSMHDSADGRRVWTIEGQATGVTFHPDGKRVVAGVVGGNVVLGTEDGKEQGRFGTAPAMWFEWTDTRLWTRAFEEAPEAWDPVSFEAAEAPVIEGTVTSAAVHPTEGWLVIDGCIVGTTLCPMKGATSARFDATGALWLAANGKLSRWVVPPEGAVRSLGPPSDRPLVTGLAADGEDWVVTQMDGVLRRLGPDGSVRFETRLPGCGDWDCLPASIGARDGGAWVIGPGGLTMEWGADGTPVEKKARPILGSSAGRLADGRWVVLGLDYRARIGDKPGKGTTTPVVVGARSVAVGGSAFAVLGDTVQPFDADGKPLAMPKLGPGLRAEAAAVSPDGKWLALVDGQGSLHCYGLADGRPRFRVPHQLPVDGISLAWTQDGERLVTGGDVVRVFSSTDGKLVLEAVLAPGGLARRLAPGPDGVGLVQGSSEGEQIMVLDVAGLAP